MNPEARTRPLVQIRCCPWKLPLADIPSLGGICVATQNEKRGVSCAISAARIYLSLCPLLHSLGIIMDSGVKRPQAGYFGWCREAWNIDYAQWCQSLDLIVAWLDSGTRTLHWRLMGCWLAFTQISWVESVSLPFH